MNKDLIKEHFNEMIRNMDNEKGENHPLNLGREVDIEGNDTFSVERK